MIPSAKARDVAGIRFLRGDQQYVVQAVEWKRPMDFNDRQAPRSLPAFRAATICSVALSVISLTCSDFISVPLCGDLVPSLEAGEPKDRDCRRMEEVNQKAAAEGNECDTRPRVAGRCASGGCITLGIAELRWNVG